MGISGPATARCAARIALGFLLGISAVLMYNMAYAELSVTALQVSEL